MATPGRLGAVKPAGAAYTTLYKPGAGIVSVCTVSFCNQAGTDDNIRISITQNAASNPTPAAADFVLYGFLVKASGDPGYGDRGSSPAFELNNANNDQIVVYSVNGNISFVATGDEGTA